MVISEGEEEARVEENTSSRPTVPPPVSSGEGAGPSAPATIALPEYWSVTPASRLSEEEVAEQIRTAMVLPTLEAENSSLTNHDLVAKVIRS